MCTGFVSGPDEVRRSRRSVNLTAEAVDGDDRRAPDTGVGRRVRGVDANSPARFNAGKSRLYEAAGCAGKLAVFAVRLDTYAKNDAEKTFYVAASDTAALGTLRRRILKDFKTLPVSAEYLHEDVFDLSDFYGKDTMVMIDKLGTDRLPTFFALKGTVDARLQNVPGLTHFTDKFMQFAASLWPHVVPNRMRAFRKAYPHHLILKMRDGGIDEPRTLLTGMTSHGALDFLEWHHR